MGDVPADAVQPSMAQTRFGQERRESSIARQSAASVAPRAVLILSAQSLLGQRKFAGQLADGAVRTTPKWLLRPARSI